MESTRTPANKEDLIFSSIYSSALAGSAIALIFLGIDTVRGDPFFTPSLIGSVVFLGQSPTAVAETRLDMIALLTIVHLVSFLGLGTASTLLYHKLGERMRHPAVLGVMIFLVMGAGLFVLDSALYPGIIAAIGLVAIGVANAVAATVMAWFIHNTLDLT